MKASILKRMAAAAAALGSVSLFSGAVVLHGSRSLSDSVEALTDPAVRMAYENVLAKPEVQDACPVDSMRSLLLPEHSLTPTIEALERCGLQHVVAEELRKIRQRPVTQGRTFEMSY